MQAVIIAVVITFIVTCAITWFVANAYQKKQTASKIGSAEDKAREIIDEAVKTAEIWIRNWKPLRSAKQVLQQKKKS